MSPRSMSRPDIEDLGTGALPGWLTVEGASLFGGLEALASSPEEYRERCSRVQGLMSGIEAEAVFVFRPSSVDYLCGHHSSAMAPQPLLLTAEGTYLYVPESEVGRTLASSCADNVLLYGGPKDPVELIADHASGLLSRGTAVAVELGQTSLPPRMVDALKGKGLRVVDGGQLVERTRLVLSPVEIDYVERAAIVTQRGVEAAAEAAWRPEATDSSVAAAIGAALFEGATSPPPRGAPVVAAGLRAGVPHSTFNRTPLRDGETTFLELAGAHHRYYAPAMRTLALGEPSNVAARLDELSRAAIAAVLGSAKPGVSCSQVARSAEEALGALEDEIVFHHNFGYPVGLGHPPTWMDSAPFEIVAGNHKPLEVGMVFPPASFRWFGVAGVGLNHTFVVEEGGARVLTRGAAEVVHA